MNTSNYHYGKEGEDVGYASKMFLNSTDSSYTGMVCAFYGKAHWDKEKINCYFSVGDCHTLIRLHLEDKDNTEPFIKKLRLLAREADKFADWLEKNT